jgi:hypothetical protein
LKSAISNNGSNRPVTSSVAMSADGIRESPVSVRNRPRTEATAFCSMSFQDTGRHATTVTVRLSSSRICIRPSPRSAASAIGSLTVRPDPSSTTDVRACAKTASIWSTANRVAPVHAMSRESSPATCCGGLTVAGTPQRSSPTEVSSRTEVSQFSARSLANSSDEANMTRARSVYRHSRPTTGTARRNAEMN